MSCGQSRVARKFHNQNLAPNAGSMITMNLRMASVQLASIGVPPRPQRVHQPRRRLQIQCATEVPQPVKIRHASQNLGSVSAAIPTAPLQYLP